MPLTLKKKTAGNKIAPPQKKQPAKKKVASSKKLQNKKTAAKKKAPAKPSGTHVLAPGGFRRIELISKARKKNGVHTVNISEFRVKPAYSTRIPGQQLENTENHLESTPPPTANTLNPNWVAYASWNKIAGSPVIRFETTYTVPQIPNDDFQTIFLFIGMQNNVHILQPVLQYGVSGAGGGSYWAISSFFAGGQADKAQYSDMVTVSPGQTLTAVIKGTPSGGGNLDYQCFFDGHNQTNLSVRGVPELTYCCGTLESYYVDDPGDYPSSFATLSDIKVSDASGIIEVPWQLSPNPGNFGEHAILDRQVGQPDQIELHFSKI
jgi:hypothetical protein